MLRRHRQPTTAVMYEGGRASRGHDGTWQPMGVLGSYQPLARSGRRAPAVFRPDPPRLLASTGLVPIQNIAGIHIARGVLSAAGLSMIRRSMIRRVHL
jgi:hypothetical protein